MTVQCDSEVDLQYKCNASMLPQTCNMTVKGNLLSAVQQLTDHTVPEM